MKGNSLVLSTSRKLFSRATPNHCHLNNIFHGFCTGHEHRTQAALCREAPHADGQAGRGEQQPKTQQEQGCSWKPRLKSPLSRQLRVNLRYPLKPHFCQRNSVPLTHQRTHEVQEVHEIRPTESQDLTSLHMPLSTHYQFSLIFQATSCKDNRDVIEADLFFPQQKEAILISPV